MTYNDTQIIVPLVMKDLVDRYQVGMKKYGRPLHTFNGREALQDAYEEVLDLAMYLKQKLMEIEPETSILSEHKNPKDHNFESTMERKDFIHPTSTAKRDCGDNDVIGISTFGSGYITGGIEHNHLLDGNMYITCIECHSNSVKFNAEVKATPRLINH